MASTYKSIYKRFNGTDWDIHYFASVTSQVASDSSSRRYVTDDILTFIGTYFDGSDLLTGMLAAKAPLANPSFTDAVTIANGLTVTQNGISILNGGSLNTTSIVGSTISINSVSGEIDFNNDILKNVGTPTASAHAATKGYVDGVVAAGMHPVTYVKAASVANHAALTNVLVVDGYTLQADDRVLLRNQVTASENGIYTSNGSGVLTKVASDSTQGAYVFVANGDTYNDWYFYCQDNNGTWIDQGRPDTIIAGSGITRTGNTISIENYAIVNDMLAGNISWFKLETDSILDNSSIGLDTWSEIPDADNTHSLFQKICHLAAAIGLSRGTAKFNTINGETIAGAYDLAEVKNRTYKGSSAPGTSGYVSGDVYLQYAA